MLRSACITARSTARSTALTAASSAGEANENGVSVLSVRHVFGVDKNVLLEFRGLDEIRNQPSRATLSSPQRAANQIFFANCFASEMQFAILKPAHFSLSDQCVDGVVEFAAGTVPDAEPPGETSRFHRLGIAFLEERDDFFLK